MGSIPAFVAKAEINMAHTGPESAFPTDVLFSNCRPTADDAAINAHRDQKLSAGISETKGEAFS